MPPRLTSLLDRPIGFAHRGARAHAPENTLEAFDLAVKLGATGLESDVWVTADGIPVLDHDGTIGRRFRKGLIADLPRHELPEHIPTVDQFYDHLGTGWPFSVDLKDPRAFQPLLDAARNAGGPAEEHLWICHHDHNQLIEWREHTDARLVDSTRRNKIKEGPERRAARLRDFGIDAINLRQSDWTGGMITMFHRFERLALGWGAQHPRELANLIDSGIDGVFSDHSDRLSEALNQFYPEP